MRLFARLGPGMMLAAVAVGVSHLVFSTQAGANYGLSLIWLVIGVSLLKYPAFRFAVDYAGATGTSLVTGYAKLGKIALAWLVVGFFFDMFIGTAAVALVTAGLVISAFELPYTGPQIAIALMVVSALVLLNGQYTRAERIVKILVIAFSILVIIAMFMALPLIGSEGRELFAELTPTRSLFVFMIAVAGWMPMPANGSVLISRWVCEKNLASHGAFGSEQARSDFRIGYSLAVFLAACFVLLGTAVLFDTGRDIPSTAGQFAAELLSVFTSTIGAWSFPVIAAAALAVMWSTLIALMDVMPRVTDGLLNILTNRPTVEATRYKLFLAVQVVGVTVIVLFFMRGFDTYVYFATSVGFLAAPAVAYFNHKAITSADVPAERRPGPFITTWNWIAIVTMTGFALAFLYTSLF